jgi:hypothetical protein
MLCSNAMAPLILKEQLLAAEGTAINHTRSSIMAVVVARPASIARVFDLCMPFLHTSPISPVTESPLQTSR